MSNLTMQQLLKSVTTALVPTQRVLAVLTWKQDVSKEEYTKIVGLVQTLIDALIRLQEVLRNAAR